MKNYTDTILALISQQQEITMLIFVMNFIALSQFLLVRNAYKFIVEIFT